MCLRYSILGAVSQVEGEKREQAKLCEEAQGCLCGQQEVGTPPEHPAPPPAVGACPLRGAAACTCATADG